MLKTLIVLVIIASIYQTPVYADLGPKPTARIKVTLDGQPIREDFEARMLVCSNKADLNEPFAQDFNPNETDMTDDIEKIRIVDRTNKCYWRNALTVWGGTCKNSRCSFSYFLPESFRLAVITQDGNFYITKKAQRTNFNSFFTVNLEQGRVGTIEETTSILVSDSGILHFLIALLITLIIEISVAFAFFRNTNLNPRLFKIVILANLCTLPALWIVNPNSLIMLLSAEIAIVIVETFIFLHFYREQLSKRRIFTYAFTANALSLMLGYIISTILSVLGVQALISNIAAYIIYLL